MKRRGTMANPMIDWRRRMVQSSHVRPDQAPDAQLPSVGCIFAVMVFALCVGLILVWSYYILFEGVAYE